MSTTRTGVECQPWSEQSPNQHTRTHANYPRAGLGGHNFCRNPDGEASPWCYTMDKDNLLRWDYCYVGTKSNSSCSSATPPRPMPAPSAPRLLACPKECDFLGGNGKCDEECNMATCLWDRGECRDLLKAVLDSARLGDYVDRCPVGEVIL